MDMFRGMGAFVFTIVLYLLYKFSIYYGIEKDFWVIAGILGYLMLLGTISEINIKNYIRADNLFLAKSKDEIADENEPVTVEEINEANKELSDDKLKVEVVNKKRGEE